ncbi:MAG: baseplate J/gp47 family protein [Minicystis sp.]
MSPPQDREKLLRGHPIVNGIDYVEIVDDTQTVLDIHFFNPITGLWDLVTGVTITGGDAIPEVPVTSLDWAQPSGDVLRIQVAKPGDFSQYTLTLQKVSPLPTSGPKLDPYFDHTTFSFKAGCPTTLDCQAETPPCPPAPADVPHIDYLAKDFQSFRDALLELSNVRYPEWVERSEADFGVMFLEALASAADDLSYYQDRVAAEAYLETATERRSLVRLARLVDYEPRPATAARVLLRINVPPTGPSERTLTSPIALRAQGPDGAVIDFELGTGIEGRGTDYKVCASWTSMTPYWWDDGHRCLRAGATEALIEDPGVLLTVGQKVLIDTAPLVPGDPPVRQVLTLTGVDDAFMDPLTGNWVTRVTWGREDALRRDHDLTRTTYCGNLVPATQGREVVELFSIAYSPADGPLAIVRTGPNGTPQYLYSLREAPLAWLGRDGDPEGPCKPEIKVSGVHSWSFKTSLLEAGAFDEHFTVDPVRYRPVGEPLSDGTSAVEYDGRDGDTIRFGDGTFGLIPSNGETFTVIYRVGGGAAGNVAAGTVFTFDPAGPLATLGGARVDNPFPATDGRDAESDESVRRRAPHAFRRGLRRAARASDYEAFARELPWVQRANTMFRHTGTWLAAFTAPDSFGSESLSTDHRIDLAAMLDRVRLAGRESLIRAPRYVPIDIRIRVCVRPDAFDEEVRGDILALLTSGLRADGTKGFFHPDRFTFGQRLSKAALEAAIQRVHGVHGVVWIQYRIRNLMDGWHYMPAAVKVEPWEIIQVDSNPSRPERGSVFVIPEGGK